MGASGSLLSELRSYDEGRHPARPGADPGAGPPRVARPPLLHIAVDGTRLGRWHAPNFLVRAHTVRQHFQDADVHDRLLLAVWQQVHSAVWLPTQTLHEDFNMRVRNYEDGTIRRSLVRHGLVRQTRVLHDHGRREVPVLALQQLLANPLQQEAPFGDDPEESVSSSRSTSSSMPVLDPPE